jgi:hypothetical protein
MIIRTDFPIRQHRPEAHTVSLYVWRWISIRSIVVSTVRQELGILGYFSYSTGTLVLKISPDTHMARDLSIPTIG